MRHCREITNSNTHVDQTRVLGTGLGRLIGLHFHFTDEVQHDRRKSRISKIGSVRTCSSDHRLETPGCAHPGRRQPLHLRARHRVPDPLDNAGRVRGDVCRSTTRRHDTSEALCGSARATCDPEAVRGPQKNAGPSEPNSYCRWRHSAVVPVTAIRFGLPVGHRRLIDPRLTVIALNDRGGTSR